jgi:hypothetical protein
MASKLKITLKPKDAAKRFRAFARDWEQDASKAHKKAILTILGWYVRWSRVDTGRFRAGWMPYADKEGYSLEAAAVRIGSEVQVEESAGRMDGSYEELGPLHTRILNGVAYAEMLDDRTGVFEGGTFLSKLAQTERIYSEQIQEFLDAADGYGEGRRPEPKVRGPAGEE